MKASDLVYQLNEMIENEGDLEVVLYTDHGQCNMTANGIEKSIIEKDQYMADDIELEEGEGLPDYAKEVICISGM